MQSNWTAAVFYMCFCIIEKCSVPHVYSVPLCILTYQRQICESHSPLKLNYCTHLIFHYLPFTEIQSYCTAVFTCVFASLKSAVSHTGWFMACQGTFLESRFLSLGFMQTQSLYHFSKVALCLQDLCKPNLPKKATTLSRHSIEVGISGSVVVKENISKLQQHRNHTGVKDSIIMCFLTPIQTNPNHTIPITIQTRVEWTLCGIMGSWSHWFSINTPH